MRPTPARVLRLTLLLALLWTPALFAQTAAEAVRRGVALRREGNDAAALAAFVTAWELEASGQTAAHLGTTHQALGHWMEAEQFLVRALQPPHDAWIVRNLAALNEALAVVRRHLGTLDIQGAPEGTEVLVDGRPVGVLPLAPLRVVVGDVTVTLRHAGYVSAVHRVSVEAGTVARESFAPLAPAPAPETPTGPSQPTVVAPPEAPTGPMMPTARLTQPTPSPRRPLRPWDTALWAVGGGGVALGIGALVAREGVAQSYNAGCPSAGSTACDGLSSQATAWTVTAAVALPLGVSALVAAVWRMVRP